MRTWQIWIDTGGTFTDCIGIDPQGQTHRNKVLSKGGLRGAITANLGGGYYAMEQRWEAPADIFEGYSFELLGKPDTAAKVVSCQLEAGQICLTRHDLPAPATFEISTGEEAPVLAARLLTATPLTRPFPALDMRIGTTRGTNALLERKGAKVALVISEGFADLPAIGTQQRPRLFELSIPDPVLFHDKVIEIPARLLSDGTEVQALAEDKIEEIAGHLSSDAVAVSLMFSYKNPAHELAIGKIFEKTGHRYCSLSHRLSPTIGLLSRTQTAVVNAYLHPILDTYLQNIATAITGNDRPLLVMSSAGGLTDARLFQPKDSLLSGPAGGVVGAAAIAGRLGIDKVITLDMGGTSTDTARYDARFDYQYLTDIGGTALKGPALAIHTVAAGGGSICRFDGFKLCVGPESAGARPGPACYGAGGPLTITDVNLLLGKLDPALMGIPIDLSASHEALERIRLDIKNQSGEAYTSEALLKSFEQIADEKMAEAIKRISIAKGFDPREYHLLAFGGAGGLHACKIAELLGMNQIILPYDGGLLSAYGIGRASIEQFAEVQVLQLIKDCRDKLGTYLTKLSAQAQGSLLSEGHEAAAIRIAGQWIFLRFKGQHHALELPFEAGANLDERFERAYRHLFGHYPGALPIEVESLRVKAVVEGNTEVITPQTNKRMAIQAQEDSHIWIWDELPDGFAGEGPAILLNQYATSYIAEGWRISMRTGKDMALQRINPENVLQVNKPDTQQAATALELFTRRFGAIAEEMGAQLQRTAFSVNIKERLDFSCALLNVRGELLVNAPHIPVHLGSLGICTRLVLEVLSLGPGDVAITNHPKYGGSHLPDVTLIAGVFSDEGQCIGYVANRAHHAEIGGKKPGSMPPDARNLEEEGVVFPPMYLVRQGQVQWPMIEQMLSGARYPTRSLFDNLADLNAALASLHSGAEALRQLTVKYGLDQVHHYMDALHRHADAALGKALAPLVGQSFMAEERLDDGRNIVVNIQVKPDEVIFNFEGSGAVHPGNLNANIAIVYSAVIYVLRLLCDEDIPLNEGLMRRVKVQLPESSFLHPRFVDEAAGNPAVVGGNTEVSQRLVDTLLKALQLAACSQGTMNNFLFGNDRFGYYETIGGGAGAGPGFNGRSAVHQHMTNTRITDPEELEWRYPVRMRQFAIRKGSGGEGRWRGGDGIRRVFEFLEPVELTILSQHRKEGPYGMAGGKDGKPGRQHIQHLDGQMEDLPGIASCVVRAGEIVTIETPGGGGFGPLQAE